MPTLIESQTPFTKELTALCHKHGVWLEGEPTVYLTEYDDANHEFHMNADSKLVLDRPLVKCASCPNILGCYDCALRTPGEATAEIATLFDAIKHGDAVHQAWLKQAIQDHFAGRPVERPKGLNSAETLAKAEAENARLVSFVERIATWEAEPLEHYEANCVNWRDAAKALLEDKPHG